MSRRKTRYGNTSGKLSTNQVKLNVLNVILLFPKTAIAGGVGTVISRMHFRFRFSAESGWSLLV